MPGDMAALPDTLSMAPQPRPAALARAPRTQVVVAASLPPGVTAAQFSSLVHACVERRLAELLPLVDCAVVSASC